MVHSVDAAGKTISHEAIYRWIYAHPKGELAKAGIMLRSKRTSRRRRKPLGERTGGRIVGMVSIDDRPEDAALRVPGAWEGDLIIGKSGKSAAATLVERHSRFVIILGLPDGKQSEGLADVLIDRISDLPRHLRGSLTWDQGTEMARHAQLTVATDMPVFFAHPHSPWERLSNENTNGLMEWSPKVGLGNRTLGGGGFSGAVFVGAEVSESLLDSARQSSPMTFTATQSPSPTRLWCSIWQTGTWQTR